MNTLRASFAIAPSARISSQLLAFCAFFAQLATMEAGRDGSGDNEARGRVLESLRDPLTGYFRRRVIQQDDVPDLVQEVFLRLSSRRTGDDIDNLRGYVFQVAASVLADRQRRRAVRHHDAHVELEPDRVADAEIPPDRILVAREALRAVVLALERLPERTRTIFVLRRLEGMRYRDIAIRLGLSVSAVEKHMVRAVEHLTACGDIR